MKRLLGVVVLAAIPGCKVATIRSLEPEGKGPAEAFDAAAYVESIWASRVVPTIESEAVPGTQLLAALREDPSAARRRFGRAARGSIYFLIKGEGAVVDVDRRSRTGLLGLDLAPADGKADVWVQIGPVVPGKALRDSVGFISFDQFVNQMDYADVGNALNDRVLAEVLAGFDADAARGSPVAFAGALTPGERLVVTPVRLGGGKS